MGADVHMCLQEQPATCMFMNSKLMNRSGMKGSDKDPCGTWQPRAWMEHMSADPGWHTWIPPTAAMLVLCLLMLIHPYAARCVLELCCQVFTLLQYMLLMITHELSLVPAIIIMITAACLVACTTAASCHL